MADKKGPTPDDIMGPGEMKPLLNLSKRDPVSCAITLTKAKDSSVILLDKKLKPKSVAAELKKQAAKGKLEIDAATLRFGHALVDTDVDASLVKFVLNKDAPGAMRSKLLEQLKKAGYTKVELTVDGKLDEAEEAETESTEAGAAGTAQPASDGAEQPAAADTAQASEKTAPDAKALTADLARMIQQIPKAANGSAEVQAALAKTATAAQASLKGGDLAAAAAGIGELDKAIQAAAAQPKRENAGPQPTKGPLVAFQTARLEWDSTRKSVARQIEAFRTAALAEFEGDEEAGEVAGALDQLDEILLNFDDTLIDRLDDILTAKDDAARQKGIADARKTLAGYVGYLTSNPLVAQLEGNNPLGVPLNIRSALVGTLKTIGANLH